MGTLVATATNVPDRALLKPAGRPERGKVKARATAEHLPWPRIGNLLLGLWLQASAFAWPRGDNSLISAWLPGLLISIIALLSMGAPPMRWLNAFLALWLMLWTVAATGTEPTSFWSGILSGALVLVLATIPSRSAASDFRD